MALKMRTLDLKDAKQAANMFNRFEMHIEGEKHTKAEVLKKTWQFPGFNLKEDARAMVDEKDNLLGYTAVWNDNKPHVQNFIVQKIEPSFMDTEVEHRLTDWAEEKAKENISKAPADAEVLIGFTINSKIDKKMSRMKKRGFEEKRFFWRMGIDLDQELEAPVFPEGITIETHEGRGSLLDIVNCDRASFKDHWGYTECPLEEELAEWEHWIKMAPYYDPKYWFLACCEGEVVGMSLCMNGMTIDEGIGYLDSVCVKKEFRKKGIASALLRHSFIELKKAGRSKAYLHVDASSLTGATKLYESVGMAVNQSSTKLEKIIRKGKSYRTESL